MLHFKNNALPGTSQAKRLDRLGPHFRPKRFSVSPWVHIWAFTGGRNARDAELLQSARATLRKHGYAFAPIGQRNRAICDASRLTQQASRDVTNQANDAFLWKLQPISARQCRNVLAEHRTCRNLPDSAPCCRAAILEIPFDDYPVQNVPTGPEEGFTLESVEADSPDSLPPGTASTDSIGIGTSNPPENRPRYRSILTRYGWLAYLHDPGGGQNERRIRQE